MTSDGRLDPVEVDPVQRPAVPWPGEVDGSELVEAMIAAFEAVDPSAVLWTPGPRPLVDVAREAVARGLPIRGWGTDAGSLIAVDVQVRSGRGRGTRGDWMRAASLEPWMGVDREGDVAAFRATVEEWRADLASVGLDTALTPAAAGLLSLRRWLREPLLQWRYLLKMARSGYYGGRAEVFHATPRGFAVYDRCSAYPAALAEPVPVGAPVVVPSVDLDYWSSCWGGPLDRMWGVGRVRVTVPDGWAGPLPVRGIEVVEGGVPGDVRGASVRSYCPSGTWTGWYDLREAAYARTCGAVVEVVGPVLLMACAAPFASWVCHVYELKRSGRLGPWGKAAFNGVAGKFGTRLLRWDLARCEPESGPCLPVDPESGLWLRAVESAPPYALPWIATAITSRARIALTDAILLRERKVFYADTDGLWLPREVDPPSPSGRELGDWRVVDPAVESAEVEGVRVYRWLRGAQVIKASRMPSVLAPALGEKVQPSPGRRPDRAPRVLGDALPVAGMVEVYGHEDRAIYPIAL